MSKACEARQYSDQMQCGRCGLAWDMNDPSPPLCKPTIDRRAIPSRAATTQARRDDDIFDLDERQRELRQQDWTVEPGFSRARLVSGVGLVIDPPTCAPAPGACAHCGRLPGGEPCDWIECAALSPRRNGCHSKPRPVAGAVTHYAQDGYYPATPQADVAYTRAARFVSITHTMSTDCRYDKRESDPACKGCPWVAPC